MEYLSILVIFLLSALYLEWKYQVHLYHSRRERIVIPLIFFIVCVLWDSYAVYRQHWIFPGEGLIGVWIGYLPLEEYLFILIMPFWAITVYKILDKKIR